MICDVVKRRRPDNIWFGEDRVIVLEVDEKGGHGSSNYSAECDLGWIMDLNAAIVTIYRGRNMNYGNVPHFLVLRFNPDEYDGGNVSLDTRIDCIGGRVNELMTCDLSWKEAHHPYIEYHYYHTKCADKIQWAKQNPDAVRVRVF